MSQIPIPEEIDRIFDKPGRDWTPEEPGEPGERSRVKVYLNTSPRREYLLLFAARKLGTSATPEDAGDAWGNFEVDVRRNTVTNALDDATSEDSEGAQADLPKRLDSVIDHYDPTKGRRFWNYLLLCFERFCWEEGKKIRRRQEKEVPLITHVETDEGDSIEVEIADEQPNTEEKLVQQVEEQEKEQDRAALRKCLDKLSPHYRELLEAHYGEGRHYDEIEKELGMAKNSAKVRCFEIRLKLRKCLRNEGVEL